MNKLTTSVFSTLRPDATLIPAPTTPAPHAWKNASITVTTVVSAKNDKGTPADADGVGE